MVIRRELSESYNSHERVSELESEISRLQKQLNQIRSIHAQELVNIILYYYIIMYYLMLLNGGKM